MYITVGGSSLRSPVIDWKQLKWLSKLIGCHFETKKNILHSNSCNNNNIQFIKLWENVGLTS